MYTLKTILHWLLNSLRGEQAAARLTIILILAGAISGVLGVCIFWRQAPSLDYLLGAGGIGIGLPTITSVGYFLYKSDAIESRRISFLQHLDRNMEQQRLHDHSIEKAVIDDLVISMVKEKLNETADAPKPKEDAK